MKRVRTKMQQTGRKGKVANAVKKTLSLKAREINLGELRRKGKE